MRSRLFLCMIMVFALLFLSLFEQGTAFSAEKTIVLKLVRAWAKETNMYDSLWPFVDRVNKKAKGRLEIKDIGGPEVSPVFEQLGMLKAGVADLVVTVPAYVAGEVPEVNAFYFNFGADLEKLRAAGVFDKLSEITRTKTGSIMILGGYFFTDFHVFLTKPITGLDDFKRLKLRSLSMYDPVFQGLGAGTVTISPAEVYSALERGVVDGLGWPDVGFIDFGLQEVTKYSVHPAFWRHPSGFVCMRAQTYDSLPGDLKDLLKSEILQIEKETPAVFRNNAIKERKKMAEAKMKQIWLSDNDWKKVQEINWERGAKTLLLDRSPKFGQELKQLMSQFYPPKGVFILKQ